LSSADGDERWSNANVLAPLGTLTAAGDRFYGIRHGRVTPELVALEADTGRRMWHFDGGPAALDESAAITVADSHVAVLSGDRLLGLDIPDGSPDPAVDARWEVEVDDPWPEGVDVGSEAAAVAGQHGDVCAYAVGDGDRLWCATVVGLAEHRPTVVVHGDVVAVVMPWHVALFAVETGALRWTFDPTGAAGDRAW
jgi:outer membrane protein assembly factor BamB